MLLVPACGWKSGAAPLSFVAAETGRGNPTATINKPAGTVSGDIMVAFAARSVATGTVTPPSGWSLLASNGGAPPVLYYKIAGGSEPASYDWTWGSGNAAGIILTYRAGVAGVTGTVSLNTTAPSITPDAAGILLAAFVALVDVTVSSPPSGMTLRGFAGGGNPSLAIYDLDGVGASATGDKAITWSGAGAYRSVLQHIEQA